jgi:hypothetical protein
MSWWIFCSSSNYYLWTWKEKCHINPLDRGFKHPSRCKVMSLFSRHKILIPSRDSNPGLLILRLMHCPLRHAARPNMYNGTYAQMYITYEDTSQRSQLLFQLRFSRPPWVFSPSSTGCLEKEAESLWWSRSMVDIIILSQLHSLRVQWHWVLKKNDLTESNVCRQGLKHILYPRQTTWGRCNDHLFLRFLPIFGEKIGVFLKNQCYDQNFA